jgi:MoxR-like ATPase
MPLLDKNKPGRPEDLLARKIPPELHDLDLAASAYEPDDRLVAAVNVALVVGAPLLVTGEPGTGKTALAHYLRGKFGLPKEQLLEFVVKSTSTAEELLWTFDTVRYFHDGQDPSRRDATGRSEKLKKEDYRDKGPLWRALDFQRAGQAAILLIDEIDKAPRDFPNDLLHELDRFESVCRPTGEKIERPTGAPPLVIITSNSERRLPEPFLRRCIFHHIEPDEATVRAAVARRTPGWDDRTRESALNHYFAIRAAGLRKPPSTGELFHWIAALRAAGITAEQLGVRARRDLHGIGALVKDREDLAKLA